MSVGIPLNQQENNYRIGMLLKNLNVALKAIEDYVDEFAGSKTDAEFIAEMGHTQEDMDIIRPALTDAYKVVKIYKGETTQSVAYDFRQKIRKLWGFGTN